MQKLILGVFSNTAQAEDALTKLQNNDYDPKEISIIMKDIREAKTLSDSTGASIAEDAVREAMTGALAGGLLGVLVGLGIPREDAQVIEQTIGQGGVLIAVPSTTRSDNLAKEILADHGAQQIRVISDSTKIHLHRDTTAPDTLSSHAYHSEIERNRERRIVTNDDEDLE